MHLFFLCTTPFASSRAATILYHSKQAVEVMWGRLLTCGRLAIGQLPVASDTVCGSAALWGRLLTCGRLAIGLRVRALTYNFSPKPGRRIANPPQIANPPHKSLD
jgi:hypothetical protein